MSGVKQAAGGRRKLRRGIDWLKTQVRDTPYGIPQDRIDSYREAGQGGYDWGGMVKTRQAPAFGPNPFGGYGTTNAVVAGTMRRLGEPHRTSIRPSLRSSLSGLLQPVVQNGRRAMRQLSKPTGPGLIESAAGIAPMFISQAISTGAKNRAEMYPELFDGSSGHIVSGLNGGTFVSDTGEIRPATNDDRQEAVKTRNLVMP